MTATCPTPESNAQAAVRLSSRAMDEAAKKMDALHWRLGQQAGDDLPDLLRAARGMLHGDAYDDRAHHIERLSQAMATALEGRAFAERTLADMDAEGAGCSCQRWDAAYRHLKDCRSTVEELEREVRNVREFLEPLARRAGAAISRIGAGWPVEGT